MGCNIPDPLKVYCLGDVKFGHQAAVLVFTILLRDLFPDPDIVLSVTLKTGWEFMRWFSKWITESLRGLEVDHNALSQAVCRRSVVGALRFRHQDGSRADHPPSRLLDFATLLGSWPSVTFGGPRYLHQARKHFVFQCRVLASMPLSGCDQIVPEELSVTQETSATYSLSGLSSVDYAVPVIDSQGCLHSRRS